MLIERTRFPQEVIVITVYIVCKQRIVFGNNRTEVAEPEITACADIIGAKALFDAYCEEVYQALGSDAYSGDNYSRRYDLLDGYVHIKLIEQDLD